MTATPAMDTDRILVCVSYERALWRRAMTGWWQSVVPPAPFARRALFWAIFCFLVGIFAAAIAVAERALPANLAADAFRLALTDWRQS